MRPISAVSVALWLAAGAMPASAGLPEQAAIKAGCQKSTNWSEKACQCIADKSASLNATQQSFLAATLSQQKAEATQFAIQMNQAQMMEAAMFMTRAGPGCQ